MYAIRETRLSIWRTLSDFFEDELVWGSGEAYTIYGLSDMNTAESSLSRPYIFLLDFGSDEMQKFGTKHLPVIVIETEFKTKAWELGSKPWGVCEFRLNVFGRYRGERDDLCGSIINNVEAITLRDFNNSNEDAIVIDTLALHPGPGDVYWEHFNHSVAAEIAPETSLANWSEIKATILVPQMMA